MKGISKALGITKELSFTLLLLMTGFEQVNAQIGELDYGYTIGTGFNGAVNTSALDANGKLVVGGAFTSYNGTNRNYIARLNADGTLDTGFDPGTGFNGTVYAIAIQSDGKIIVGGDFTTFNGNTQNVIFRLNTNGSYDNTFVTTGTGLNNLIYALAIQSDGKIVVGGMFASYNGTSRNYIARLNDTGTLDTGFTPGTGFSTYVRTLVIQSDGKIIAGGDFVSFNGTTNQNYIARLNTDGSIDGGFLSGFGFNDKVYALYQLTGGKILVGGGFSSYSPSGGGTTFRNRIALINADGSLDNTFVPPVSSLLNGTAKAFAVQADGKILVGGSFTTYGGLGDRSHIMRLSATGVAETAYDGNTLGTINERGFNLETRTLAMQGNGDLIAGGNFTAYFGNERNYIARIKADCNQVGITTSPVGVTICDGANASYTVVATGSGLSYQWQESTGILFADLTNGGIYSGVTSATLTLTAASASLSGKQYRCVVTSGSCKATSAFASLTVNTIPSISNHPSAAAICTAANTSFTVTATGTNLTYAWQVDDGSGFVNLVTGGNYSGATSATLNVIAALASFNSYKYRCIVGTCTPSVISNEAILTVNAGPTITTQPVNSSLCNSGNTTFNVVATGAVTYQWQKNNANISDGGIFSGVTTSTLTITGATTADNSTSYRCVVTAGNTCTTNSGSATLFVYSTPVVSTHPANSTKCAGANTTFTVAVTSPPAGLTYQWQEKIGSGSFANLTNGGVYSTVTAATLTLTGVTAGMNGNKYRCVVGTCSTPVNSFEADLIVDSPPVIMLQPVASIICAGMTTTFTTNATMTGGTFKWQKETTAGSSSYADITNSGIYSGATTEILTLTNATVNESGFRYRCVITASGVCAAVNTSTALLTVRAIPTFNTQPVDKAVCEGLTTTFSSSVNFGGAPSSYQWQVNEFGIAFIDIVPNTTLYPNGVNSSTLTVSPSLSMSGNKYRVRVGACQPEVFSSEVTLTVNQTPTITSQPISQTICKDGTTTFSIAATGSSLIYQWLLNGATISDSNFYSGATTSTLTITGAIATFSGHKFSCRVTGATGCQVVFSEEATLTVNDIKIITQPVAASICSGGTQAFTVTAEGPALTYQWKTNDGVSISNGGIYSGATTATLTVTAAIASASYQCVVTGTCGVITSSSVNLTVTTVPKPTIVVNVSNPESPTLITGGGSTYQWFKNGTAISGATSSAYNVTTEGSYTVQAIINNCVSEMSGAQAVIVTGDLDPGTTTLVKVYPNPGSDQITLSLDGFEKDKPVAISIVDMQGRTIDKTTGLGQREVSIDIRNYTNGKYIAWLQQRTTKVSQQFIKNDK